MGMVSGVLVCSDMAGWKSVDEIRAYQLSCELRDRTHEILDAGRVKDADFADQIRRSTSSAPSNLSEGFERYYHGEFAYLASVAKASLGETINHLRDPRAKKQFLPNDRESLLEVATSAKRATAGLLKYLISSTASGQKRPPKPRTNRRP